MRLLETGAWRLRGYSRLARDVGGNAEKPGRNQGELRSWEEAREWSVRFCAECRIWWALVGSGRLITGDVDEI